jgi:hypothetical protein
LTADMFSSETSNGSKLLGQRDSFKADAHPA